jgi:hypothetical protein
MKDVTDNLWQSTLFDFHRTGIKATAISAQLLRAGEAMAIFFEKIEMHNIHLMGQWHSDTTMWYLHGHTHPLVGVFAVCMYNDGEYTFQPN